MTSAAFRKLALSMPEAEERAHMSHPDFRVRGKIFATLGYPNAATAMVELTNADQDLLCRAKPKAFAPVPGGWGAKGSTRVMLKHADKATTIDALRMAWRKAAPRSLGLSD
jgi:hypothetical protein